MKFIKYLITSIIYTILIINSCNAVENKILFRVNNEIITSIDILTELEYLKTINKEFRNTEQKRGFEISKNSLIKEKIKEIEIKKLIKEIKIEDKILNNLILNYFSELEIKSIFEFEKYFLNKDIDPNLIKKKISLELLWNQLIYEKYNKTIRIDENSIKNDLLNNKKKKNF